MCNKQKYEDLIVGFEFEVEGDDVAILDLADNTRFITKLDVPGIADYHDTRWKTYEGLWRLEYDSSIDGAEFISPPKKYADARNIMKKFFTGIEQTPNVYTTEACGMHCSISIDGNLDGVDREVFMTNINTRLLYKLWPDRFGVKYHEYCNNFEQILVDLSYDAESIDHKNLAESFFYRSYGFVTIKEMCNQEYIEIRVPGGINYHKNAKMIFTTIEHIADALYNAKIKNKKTQQKMISYANRINNKREIVQHMLSYDPKELIEKYNQNYYLYYLLKTFAFAKMSRLTTLKDKIDSYSMCKRVAVPETETNSEKLKLLKHWKKLPKDFCKELIFSLNKRALRYFVKYNPSYPRTSLNTLIKSNKLKNTDHLETTWETFL